MDNFTERMLERTQRRQQLLVSASSDIPIKELSPTPVVEILTSTQKSPPQRMRRNRFAELASRVDMWLEEDTDFKPKSIENDPTVTFLNNHVSKQAVNKSKTIPSLPPVITEGKLTETDNNKSTLTQQPEPQFNFSLMQRLRPPQLSPDKTALTVAQRRALFEKNIAPKQQIKKPTTTTIVTISLTKTTATKTTDTTATITPEKEHNEPVLEVMTTPPRPIPCSKTTPPSRCGTRPRGSPAVVALGNLPKPRTAWTPPCIKNVLLKKNLITELDDDQSKILENETTGTIVATSSPIGNTRMSSADCIAMSVRPVQFVSPSSSLYPNLSLIENDNECNNRETVTSPLENQYTRFKRRSNGISVSNASTTSSDTVYENTDDEMLGAKRSRCDSKPMNNAEAAAEHQDIMTVVTTEESSPIATGSTNTPSSNISSSILSDHTTDQTCVSFTYYCPDKHQELPPKCQQLINENPQKNKCIEPALVHTISTYRKQQKQLRISGKPSSKEHTGQLESDDEEEEYSRSALLHQRLKLLNDDDDEEIKLQELETVAERARNLERVVVPEQDRIIDQATQALNICDVYRQKNGLRPVVSNKFAPEHLHAERLLLIAGLRRTDAVREAQRLRVERTLLPGGTDRHLKVQDNGRTLVIESLRVPILSAVATSNNKVTENLTRWPGGYRYFVCAIRAAATGHRPPVTSATRPVDAIEESLLRFSGGSSVARCDNDGVEFGYVEFITKTQIKLYAGRKWPVPTEAEGAPIMINGLDDEGWKITIELYGLSPTAATGEPDHHNGSNNSKEHDGHENIKSVLDKFWYTVTTPSKESKKHATTTSSCIESPGGPMAVRNTVFRQLGYFVFSDRQVDRQQFTLNKVHQSRNLANVSKATVDETVRVRMCLLEEGEQYIYDNGEGLGSFDDPSLGSNKHDNSPCALAAAARKPLRFPSECKRTEGFLTLFDDHELRTTPAFEQEPKWRPHSNVSHMTVWRRLWFCAEIIDDPKRLESRDISNDQTQQQMNVRRQKTIVLRCWLYPEHAEQQREPIGTIDLGRCLQMTTSTSEQQHHQTPVPAAPAHPDLCLRPNSLRLLLYSNDNYDGNGINDHDDPLLLSADTADERREWCDTINAAVHAISEHRKWIENAEAARLKQKRQDKDDEHRQRLQNEQHTGAWPPISGGSGKSFGRKKKLHK